MCSLSVVVATWEVSLVPLELVWVTWTLSTSDHHYLTHTETLGPEIKFNMTIMNRLSLIGVY